MPNQGESKITDILYGKLSFSELMPPSPVCKEIIEEVVAAEKNLMKKIKDDSDVKERVDAFIDCIERLHSAESDHFFAEGFKTGLMIGIEAGEWTGDKLK